METVLLEGREGITPSGGVSLGTPRLVWCAAAKVLDSSRLNELEAAYRATLYQVPEPALTLEIGKPSPDLMKLCQKVGASSWAFVTACNPNSEMLSDNKNQQRMRHLRKELTAVDYRFFEAVGSSPEGTWIEPSYFVLGMTEAEAVGFGDRWGQAGVVVEMAINEGLIT